MKKIFMFLLLILVVSCNKEQKEIEECQEKIVGDWGFYDVVTETVDDSINIVTFNNDETFIGSSGEGTYTMMTCDKLISTPPQVTWIIEELTDEDLKLNPEGEDFVFWYKRID